MSYINLTNDLTSCQLGNVLFKLCEKYFTDKLDYLPWEAGVNNEYFIHRI